MGGGVIGAGNLVVTPIDATTYTVSADTGTGNGTLGLDLADDDSIADLAGNPLADAGIHRRGHHRHQEHRPDGDGADGRRRSRTRPARITLTATDPELDPLTFKVTSLPAHGTLSDAGGDISAVPHTFTGQLVYTPDARLQWQRQLRLRRQRRHVRLARPGDRLDHGQRGR